MLLQTARLRRRHATRRGVSVLVLLVLCWAVAVVGIQPSHPDRPSHHAHRPVLGVGPASARGGLPELVQEDLVTDGASSYPQADGWGAQGDRLVRTSSRDLYTTYVTGGWDPDHFGWVLSKRSAGGLGWVVVASGVTAHEPGNPPAVLVGPSGTVFVITISAWDSAGAGAPQIWDSASGITRRIPGRWLTGAAMKQAGALYPSASIDSQGNIYVWEDVPCPFFTFAHRIAPRCQSTNVPGTYYWAYRTARDGRWHAKQWQNAFRQTYNFLLPYGLGRLGVVGTRDILAREARYGCPNGTGYCFDQVRLSNLGQRVSSTLVALAARGASGYTGDHRASAEDAYVDTRARTHVLVSVVDATTHGAYANHHLVIDPNGNIKDVRYSVPYPNLSRIIQDTTGRFWIYSVGPGPANAHRCELFIAGGRAGDTDGTDLGPVTVIPFAAKYDCKTESRNFDVSPRTGTPLANYIDGVMPTNGGHDWVHYRIALPTNPDPTP
jgi:hypothetical protein